MKDDKEHLLNTLASLIASIEEFKEGNFLKPTNSLYNSVLAKCAELLRNNGYVVSKCELRSNIVKSTSDLVNHYYNYLRFVIGGKIIPYRSDKADLAVAKSLLVALEDNLGVERKAALDFSVKVVSTFFNIYKDLDIDGERMASFRAIFGQDKMRWVTERVIQHINKEAQDQTALIAAADKETELYIEKKNVEFGWPDLEELVKGVDDGKEKRNR